MGPVSRTARRLVPVLVPLAVALALGAQACVRKKEAARAKDFDTAATAAKDGEVLNFRIAGIEEIRKGFPDWKDAPVVRRVKLEAFKGEGGDEATKGMAHYLDVHIGALPSQAAYDALMARYGGKGNVPWTGNETKADWNLLDFLPPFAQAVNATRFNTKSWNPNELPDEISKLKRMDVTIDVQTNCHATAYEFVRSLASPDALPEVTVFFLGDESEFHFFHGKTLDDGALAQSEEAARLDEQGRKLRNEGRKLGDVIQLWAPGLLHSAVWVDEELFFEKSDTASAAPYRLVTYADMLEPPGIKGIVVDPRGTAKLKVGYKRFDPAKVLAPGESPFDFFAGNFTHRLINRMDKTVQAQPEKLVDKGVDPKVAPNYYVVRFTGMGGRLVSDPILIKNFRLEADATTKRAKLPDAAYVEKTFTTDIEPGAGAAAPASSAP